MTNVIPSMMAAPPLMIPNNGEPSEPNWRLVYDNPDHCHLASSLWAEAVLELRKRHLADRTDPGLLRRLIGARVVVELSWRDIAARGAILRPRTSADAGLRNPNWQVWRQATEAALKIEIEAGLGRLRPGQAVEAPAPRKPVPSDAYLKR